MKIFDIIEYGGDNSSLIWKHPATDFNTHSTLIVRESQEAIFFKNGQALDTFTAGKHTLHTDNIPLLRHIVNIPTGGESPFKCEVYFINKVELMGIKWGVFDIDFIDQSVNGYKFTLGANGELSIKITDPKRLLVGLVGSEDSWGAASFSTYFKSLITMNLKSMLPKLLSELGATIYTIESDLPKLSEAIRLVLSEGLADYGVTISKFWINSIVKPVDDPVYQNINRMIGESPQLALQAKLDYEEMLRRKTIELEELKRNKEIEKTEAVSDYEIQMTRKKTEFETGKMDVDLEAYRLKQTGITRQQELGFEVMNSLAQNEGSGSDLRNMGMELGMGFGVGGAFGGITAEIAQETLMSGLMSTPDNVFTNSSNGATKDDPFSMDSMMTGNGVQGEIDLNNYNNSFDADSSSLDSNKTDSNNQNQTKDINWFKEEAEKLKMLNEMGLLSPEEFAVKKKELLDAIG